MASSLAANPAWQAEPLLDQLYGKDWRELPTCNPNLRLVTSFEREVDLVELEQFAMPWAGAAARFAGFAKPSATRCWWLALAP